MKKTIVVIAMIVAVIVMVFGVIYTLRFTSNVLTPITIHTPTPGVTCAAMVTGDGAAISCWKD